MGQIRFQLPKTRRLCSQKSIQQLFKSGKKLDSESLFLLYCPSESCSASVGWQVMFIVPKKRIRRSVCRVSIRRRMREAFRLSQHQVPNFKPGQLLLAFIYKNSSVSSFVTIKQDIVTLLSKLSQRCLD